MTSQPGDIGRPLTTEPKSAPLQQLLEVLSLTPSEVRNGRHSDDQMFAASSLHQPTGRVYGGQVLAQALLAAGATVDADRLPHSLHGYFLRAGDVRQPVTLGVECLRDGRSFATRRTHAYQEGTPILSMIASFQLEQDGLDRADAGPNAPHPDDVPSTLNLLGKIDHPIAQFWSTQSAFDIRHIQGQIYLGPGHDKVPDQAVWMRSRGRVDGSQLLHRAILAYACDQLMLEPVLRAAGKSWMTTGLSLASLDHAMWWHRNVRVDEWLLYVQHSPSSHGGRGLGTAQVFAQDGTLVATIAQEGMVRVPEE